MSLNQNYLERYFFPPLKKGIGPLLPAFMEWGHGMCILKKLVREPDMDSHEFIHPFISHVLRAYYGLDTMVGAGDTVVRRKMT